MDQSVGSTIEKIKQQEQDLEIKLKEKREYEATVLSLNRAIRDAYSQAEKSDQEQCEITKRIEKLRPLLEIEKIRRNTLLFQLQTVTAILDDLRARSVSYNSLNIVLLYKLPFSTVKIQDRGITNVWSLRSTLCEAVHNVSNECDIWSLLIRPVNTAPLPFVVGDTVDNKENDLINEGRLQSALARRATAETERERLLVEPDVGEEFVRIKNALRYSLDKIKNLKK
ncbi:uncharacterized protein [Epargyreus clarus]|uniref:uncharacterized protein n=1 Tax=Epargyreus clarus TaxID=520877 RepID=UPI003C2BF40C